MISPTDIRHWIMPCQRPLKCPTRTDACCHGCLGNGFTVDLTGIRKLTSLHPNAFRYPPDRGPNDLKPWNEDYVFDQPT